MAELTEDPKPLRFGVNTIASIGTLVVGQILGWIGTKALFIYVAPSASDTAGVALIGDITFFVTIFNLVLGIGGFRIGAAYTFFVSRGAAKKRLTGSYFLFTLVSFAALSGFVFLLGVGLNWFPGLEEAFGLFMLVPIIEVPSTIYQNLRIAERRAAHGQIPPLVEATVRMGLIVYFAHLWTPHTISTTAGADALVNQIALAYVVGALAGLLTALPMFAEVAFVDFWPTLKDMLAYATPLAAGLFLTYAGSFITPILVRVLSNAIVLQEFSSPNAFLILLLFLPYAVTLPLFPDLAGMHARGEDEAIRLRVRQAIRYTLMLLTPGILVICVFRVDLLDLFYSNAIVAAGSTALIVLAISAIPTSVFRITGTALDAVGLQRREFWISSAQFIVLVGALVLLVRPYAVLGAAYAVLLSAVAGLALNAAYMYRYLPVRFPLRAIVTVTLASVITFAVFSSTFLGFLGIHLDVANKFVLIPVILLGLGVYLLVIAAVGELAKQDVRDLVQTAGLPERWGNGLARLCWRDSWIEEGHAPPPTDP